MRLLLAALLAASAAASASAEPADSTLILEWTGSLDRADRVEVRNPVGAVYATPSPDGRLHVRAYRVDDEKRTPKAAEVRVLRGDEAVTLCAVYEGASDDHCTARTNLVESCRGGTCDGSHVSLHVQVPAAPLNVRVGIGLVRSRRLAAPLHVWIATGDVDVETSSTASAWAGAGRIAARIGALRWDGELKLEAALGEIEVWLPRRADVRVDADVLLGETRVPDTFLRGAHRLRLVAGLGDVTVHAVDA